MKTAVHNEDIIVKGYNDKEVQPSAEIKHGQPFITGTKLSDITTNGPFSTLASSPYLSP